MIVNTSRGTSRSINTHVNDVVDVIILNIMISLCCFQLLHNNTLYVVHNLVSISCFVLFCVLYLVCPTLFPVFCFHSKQMPAFRRFLKNKSGALRLASLALPWSLTSASADVRFPQIRKHLILFQKRTAFRLFLKNKSGALLVYY